MGEEGGKELASASLLADTEKEALQEDNFILEDDEEDRERACREWRHV